MGPPSKDVQVACNEYEDDGACHIRNWTSKRPDNKPCAFRRDWSTMSVAAPPRDECLLWWQVPPSPSFLGLLA